MLSLQDLKKFLVTAHVASLFEISKHFNVDADLVRARISHFVKKGHVRCVQKTAKCGSSCSRCSPLITELYEWVVPVEQ